MAAPPTTLLAGLRSHTDGAVRCSELRHIRELRFWDLPSLLMEKYDFTPQDATALAEFIGPMLAFDPKDRASAGACKDHQWVRAAVR